MPKVVSTIIEDEVTFLTNVDVEYVSLVRHGANRTPFKILKSDKGGSTMEKVVIAVLIPKSISDEDAKAHLEGYRTDEVKEYDTYKSYIQVDQESIDLESAEIIQLNDEARVLGVVAFLAKSEEKDPENAGKDPNKDPDAAKADEKIEPKVIEKEALDYATLDDVYMELYAMADIVGGALRQSTMNSSDRKKIVSTAISNFATFADMVLSNTKAEKVVKVEDHPALLHHTTPMEARKDPDTKDPDKDAEAKAAEKVKAAEEAKAEKEAADAKAAEEAAKDPDAGAPAKITFQCSDCGTIVKNVEECKTCPDCGSEKMGTVQFDEKGNPVVDLTDKIMEKVQELLTGLASVADVDEKLEGITDKITEAVESITTTVGDLTKDVKEKFEALKDLPKTVKGLTENVEKLENTPVAIKSDPAESQNDTAMKQGDGSFNGTIFQIAGRNKE
jgi:rubrerythrin/uncharacterized protein YoxC